MTRRTGSSEVAAEVFVAFEVFVVAEVLVVPFSFSGLFGLLSVFPAFSSDFSVLDSFFSVFRLVWFRYF
mgnify:CR=1 FL=1